MSRPRKYFTEEERLEAKRESRRRSCAKYYLKEENRNKIRDRAKQWREKNKVEIVRQRHNKHLEQSIAAYIVRKARSNSINRNLDFNLKKEDIYVPDACPYLGCTLIDGRGVGKNNRLWNSYSIDRINSTKGYTKNNVIVISSLANQMKTNATEEQLIAFAKGVLRIHAGIDVDKISSECRPLQQVPSLHSD